MLVYSKEPSIKDVRSQGRRRFAKCGHFSDREGGLHMRTSALFGAKFFEFFEIYVVSARTRGVEPVQTFCGERGRRSIFRDFVRTSFKDGPKLS